jgi:sugar phosphate isomerase/epimerase
MKPSLNQLTIKTTPFEKDLEVCAKAGFSAIEIFYPKLEAYCETHSYQQARQLLDQYELKVTGSCGGVMGMLLCQRDEKQSRHKFLRHRLEQCEQIGATQINVVTDLPEKPASEHFQIAQGNLVEISEMAAKYGVELAIEFVGWSHFLAGVDSTMKLIRSVEVDNVGIVFDTFHFTKGNSKFTDLEALTPTDILCFHINDAPDIPREVVTDADRVVPGQGTFLLKQLIQAVKATGYDGYATIELLNPHLWEEDPLELASATYKATAALLESV